MLASPRTAALSVHPNVERVHVFRKKKPLGLPGLIRELRRERFDAVVNLVFYPSFTGALISRLGAPGRAVRVRVATGDGLDHFYNVNIRRRIWGGAVRTMQEETLSVFEYLGGDLSGRDTAPAVYPGEERLARAAGVISGTPPSAILIGVNIAAGDACREWSTERWAETLKLLLERFPGSTLYLFAPPGDDRGNRLANLSRTAG
ncbi:MAG: hypothetical protein MZV70_43265 [Desulfobacterales bacterium]|nr:hypothetical protein [Desulfobacterales bacterium]